MHKDIVFELPGEADVRQSVEKVDKHFRPIDQLIYILKIWHPDDNKLKHAYNSYYDAKEKLQPINFGHESIHVNSPTTSAFSDRQS